MWLCCPAGRIFAAVLSEIDEAGYDVRRKETIIRDVFGMVKEDGFRQYNTAYVEIDGAVAAIMALDRAVQNGGRIGSVYDERGI